MKRKLENITLFGADHKPQRLLKAFEICESYFDFADKKLLTNTDNETVTGTGIKIINKDINSLEAYSHLMIKELSKYIETEYVLVIQYDGFILNPNAWTDEFLEYDYIGAPWWYTDDCNMGNGGFSLRSKRLLNILANDTHITDTHPEDHHICRTYGEYLKSKGIRFAPEKLAKRFSIEGALFEPVPVKYGSIWTNELGFHSLKETDLSNWKDWNKFFPKEYNRTDLL